MADISIDQIKQIVGGLYLENAMLRAKLASQPVFELIDAPAEAEAASPDDEIAKRKRPPNLQDVTNNSA